MANKHTPGPWKLRSDPGGPVRRPYWIQDADGAHVADVWWDQPTMENEDVDANARLISSAPDLLEACRRIVMESAPEMPPTLSAIEQCLAAIAKATGGNDDA